jgi:hypothetical protein
MSVSPRQFRLGISVLAAFGGCALIGRDLRTRGETYSLALAKARPDPDFKYFSKAIARGSSANAM